MGDRMGYLTEIFNSFTRVKSLVPVDPENKHLCLSTNYHKQLLLTFIVDFWKRLSMSTSAALSKWYTCITVVEKYI